MTLTPDQIAALAEVAETCRSSMYRASESAGSAGGYAGEGGWYVFIDGAFIHHYS